MRLRLTITGLFLAGLLGIFTPGTVWAADPPEIALNFFGDRYEPVEVPVPAGVKFVLRIVNKSTVSTEWESKELHREKVVPAGKEGTLYIGPLKPGEYEFFDDFHPKVRGKLVAR